MLRIAVLVSGGGTNLQAIIDAIAAGKITDTEIAAVISNNRNAYALERAKQAGIKDIVVSPKDFETRDVFNENLLKILQEVNPDLIVLAGYLVVIPEIVIDAFENRIINIHPSLIPAFCGTGYYGLKVHEAALKRGVKVVGATVHFVDKRNRYRSDHYAESGCGTKRRYSEGASAESHGAGRVEYSTCCY